MDCKNKIGGSFNSLAQRLVYMYIATYPKFIPANTDEVEAQKQTHSFLGETLSKIYENPAIIDLPMEQDDCFNGEPHKDKPELYKTMRNLEKKFLGFFDYIYELGCIGTVKDNKLHILKSDKKILKNKLIQLGQFDLEYEVTNESTIIYSKKYPDLCSGLKFLSGICKLTQNRDIDNPVTKQSITRLMFMHCIFDKKNVSFADFYGGFTQSGGYLEKLEKYFLDKGYSYDINDGGFNLHRIYPDKSEGSFNTGLDWRNNYQIRYSIGVPDFRILMNHFREMDDELKQFFFSRTNVCTGCGYCTQTDKTGKRKPLSVQIEFNGEIADKCPLYPNLGWASLDGNTLSLIKKIYAFAEETLYNL